MSKPLERLRQSLLGRSSTQMGIGPMSVNCVDAVIELANTSRVPLMLIASRRQIECDALGGGYVNNWTTEEFARYVRQRDRGGYVVLCRDHGGPWQNYGEVDLRMSLRDAMASAKESFRADLHAGFDIIHIDPSIDIHQEHPDQCDVIDRLFELYEYCIMHGGSSSFEIEIGSEEQSGVDQDLSILRNTLDETLRFCRQNALPRPLFVVAQTGTLVKETSNVGTFDEPFRRNGTIPPEILVPELVDLCGSHGVYLKEHNGDYLSNEALMWHPRLRIHAANIAPEFGVVETRHILSLCRDLGLRREAERFLTIAHASGRWRKWMLEGSQATDTERAVIAGHYVFGHPEFQEVLKNLRTACAASGFDLDASIREAIKLAIMRIMACFNLCHPSTGATAG